MKVLQINSVCGYGSTGRIATDFYDVLEKEGHECCIAYGRGKAPEKYKTIKIGNKMDFLTHVLKSRIFDLHGFGSRRATKKFINQIKDYSPDIIQIHNIHGYYINVQLLFEYLKTISTPVVWLLHDAWAISGHSAHFELDNKGNIPTKNSRKNQHKEYPKSLFCDNSKKNYQQKEEIFSGMNNLTIVTPSNWLAELVKKSFLNEYKIKVIHNGIDLNIFKPTKSNFRNENYLNDKKILLGVASIWSEKKGIHIFNELAARLGNGYKIVLVGVDKDISKKMNSDIICINRTNDVKELAGLYSTSDIFLNPTLEDNFPTTNIEALACGTPVITFDTGGSPESITNETGKIIKKGDIDEFINAIDYFNDCIDNNHNCIKQARIFNKNDVFIKYIELYKELLLYR